MLFKQVIGHEDIKRKLLDSTRSGRVSHAQLFLGETGSGILPLALAYAQYVNCHNPGPDEACGECDACRKTQSLEYPDLHFSYPVISKKASKPVSQDYLPEWRKAVKENAYLSYQDWMNTLEAENKQGNITAEECRDIIRKLSLKPLYTGYKILLMWLPEYLGKEGNILLKILEEPPTDTLFLLLAEDEERILPTILSRTQVVRLPRISDEDMIAAIQQRLGVAEEDAARISFLAEGNFNKAQKLFGEGENNYTEEFINWMRACFRPDMSAVLKWVDGMAGTGRENQKNFLSYGLNLLRESLLISEGLPELTRLLDSEKEFIQKFSTQIGPENILPLHDGFSRVHYHIERNGNPKILFFNLSLLVNELLQRQRKTA